MEKEPCTKFYGVLISSHEVMKLESFQSSASDVVSANVQNISALVFFVHFCQFYENEIFTQFYGRFDHFLRTYSAANF